ncbi:MAG: tRNA (N6-isopentenyl adenosine(37)-C2)-methylthiotransferase MiaB [Ruminococcaceae bacterium]|nr:tRNA (N6-isopentenyl adenosine(37)-C2)-methylthiotransferase MiaB [Oscillospiraceae bacterium]
MNDIYIPQSEIQKQLNIADSLKDITKGKKACVITFGCQQNENDSERIAGALEMCGYEITDNSDIADVIIINTCAIREHAEIRALSEAGQFKGRKAADRSIKIGLCGCMAQQSHRREQIYKSYPYVDFIFGTDMHHRLPEIIKTALESKKRVSFITDKPHNEFGVISEGMPVRRESGYKAWVPVMYGCNNFCTYCVVPYARGQERSRKKEEVLAEVESLVKQGYKDITLLGQNVNSFSGGCSFAELLDKCASFEGEYTVRFMTSHPKDASDELIEVMANNPKVAKHFHLPVQSGSSRVLKLMNRKYDREKYLETAMKIKARVPNVSLTTDIIVAFPTETETDFADTMSLVENVGFDMIYTFIYSPRVGTVAAKMEGQIKREIANVRFKALSDLQNDVAQRLNEEFIGRTVRVLSDGYNKNGIPCGRSSQNKIVTYDKYVPEGQFVDVKVENVGAYLLNGKII